MCFETLFTDPGDGDTLDRRKAGGQLGFVALRYVSLRTFFLTGT